MERRCARVAIELYFHGHLLRKSRLVKTIAEEGCFRAVSGLPRVAQAKSNYEGRPEKGLRLQDSAVLSTAVLPALLS